MEKRIYQSINKKKIFYLLYKGLKPIDIIKEVIDGRTQFRFQFEVIGAFEKNILNEMRNNNLELDYEELTKAMDIYYELVRAKYPRK